jgi:hypothetical protein
MSGSSCNLECPECRSQFVSLFTRVDADETVTCSCGHEFAVAEAGLAELERIRQERVEELAEIHAGVVFGAKELI